MQLTLVFLLLQRSQLVGVRGFLVLTEALIVEEPPGRLLATPRSAIALYYPGLASGAVAWTMCEQCLAEQNKTRIFLPTNLLVAFTSRTIWQLSDNAGKRLMQGFSPHPGKPPPQSMCKAHADISSPQLFRTRLANVPEMAGSMSWVLANGIFCHDGHEIKIVQ